MTKNPFTSSIFEQAWRDFYCKGKEVIAFDAISGVKFTKHNTLPIYVNLGENQTNGMSYNLTTNTNNFRHKVALIYDVPDYFNLDLELPEGMILKKARQYDGYYGDISGFETSEDILNAYFNSSKSKYNFKRSLKILEGQTNLKHTVYFGAISKEDYDREMEVFKSLLSKRFDDKNVFNTVLPMWDFYEALIYPLILDKKVALNVIYSDTEPIAMSINFLNDKTLQVAIRTFDIDYYKMNIGNIEIFKLMEWAIGNAIDIIDFSKGENYYKKRWTTTQYFYDHHIIYDSTSAYATFLGNSIASFFKFKQYLRDKNINSLYVKAKHLKRKILFQK